MECTIRPAIEADAGEISPAMLRALRKTNARGYTKEIIERIRANFGRYAVRQLIGKRTVFVATIDGCVVGTASLDGNKVHSVFVAPDAQARGIGTALMAEIESTARERNILALILSSSITAETFYARIGFTAVRENYYGDERRIVMERLLDGPA